MGITKINKGRQLPGHTNSTLREKWPIKEFFLVRIILYSVPIQENTDQKKLRIWRLFTQCNLCHASSDYGMTQLKLCPNFKHKIWTGKTATELCWPTALNRSTVVHWRRWKRLTSLFLQNICKGSNEIDNKYKREKAYHNISKKTFPKQMQTKMDAVNRIKRPFR